MTDPMNRRSFLRIGGGTLLACAAERALASDFSQGAGRSAPDKPIVLKTADLELVLDPEHGLPYEYRLPKLQTRFRGDVTGHPMVATVCDKANWKFVPISLEAEPSRTNQPGSSTADFTFHVKVEDRPAADFTVRYRVMDGSVFVGMYDVREHDGFELIDVAMPALVSVAEEDGEAWLAHGETGGSLTRLADAKAGSLPPNRFWGKVLATLPVLMLGNGKGACALEIQSFMDGADMTVSGDAGHRTAVMGTIKTYRINGSACWDMNTGNPQTTRNCGNTNTPNLQVEAVSWTHAVEADWWSKCRLDFVGDRNHDGVADWLDAAELVRERMPAIKSHLYDNAFVYGILLDQPLFDKPTATFDDCEQIIRNIAALTDNGKQIVHLWGWQFHGKDSGYPAVNQVDSRIGGYEAMMRLKENAKKYNCTVTLSDNYDDAYRSSPAWNPDWIARRPDGELWESRNWTGENSYILGIAKYVEAAGLERVRYTCERYQLPDTTHVDVLSYYPIRNDWDAKRPASGTKNLQARYQVVEEFNKHGVDVSSEALRYAFLGTISSFWYMTGPSADPFGGQPIPLLATIYRKSAAWGQSGRMDTLQDGMLKMLFYNGYAHASFRGASDLRNTTDLYYLMMLPWFQLHGRNIKSFHRDGERTTIRFEGNAIADMDWEKKTYSVTIDGVEIARDMATFCPLDKNRIAFYSASPQELSARLPEGWQADKVVAIALSTDVRKEVSVAVKDGMISIRVQAQQPVIVYADRRHASASPK